MRIQHIPFTFLFNAIGFEFVWFICVQGNNLHAGLATLLFLAVHYAFLIADRREVLLIIAFALIGWLFDSLMAVIGFITYDPTVTTQGLSVAPFWFFCLWLNFAATLAHSLLAIVKNRLILVLICLVAIPLSYRLGIHFSGAEILVNPFIYHGTQALFWFFALSVGLRIAKKLHKKT